jgi:hypothetical protein
MPLVHERQLRGRAYRRKADRLHEPPDVPAGGPVEDEGGWKPWPESEPPFPGYGLCGYPPCGAAACGGATGGVTSRARAGLRDRAPVAACVPRAAPNANAAVIAAAPAAAHAVTVLTRRLAPALSIAMPRSVESLDKPTRSRV